MESFTALLQSEVFKDLLNSRQFLLDNYTEARPPKLKKGPGRTPMDIPLDEQDYKQYIKLNEIWQEYITELLSGNYSEKNICNKIIKADMHGALVSVWKASCKSYEGQKGIVLQETMKSFRVITKENKVKSTFYLVFLKKDAIFLIEIQDKIVKIFGENFVYRPADRSKIKWRQKDKLKILKR
jgi:ribonuclease P protein subunit POP4